MVRFEMMFHVRCEGCLKSIGKGVRFNAKKFRVGEYLSTPIYAFHMTCHLCGHELVVETDPQSTNFVMKKGLHRIRPKAYDGIQEDTGIKADGSEREPDAFETLERVKLDKEVGKASKPTLEKLLSSKEEKKDDFSLNQKLRAKFRSKKSEIAREESRRSSEVAKFGMPVVSHSQLP